MWVYHLLLFLYEICVIILQTGCANHYSQWKPSPVKIFSAGEPWLDEDYYNTFFILSHILKTNQAMP